MGALKGQELQAVVDSQVWMLRSELRTSEEQQLFLNTEHLSSPKF